MPNNAAFGHDASSFPAQPTVPTQGATPPKHFDGDDPSWAVAAKQFAQVAQHVAAKQSVEFAGAAVRRPAGSKFFPSAPNSIHDAGLHERLVESLVLKYLLNVGSASGRGMARQVGLPFHTMEALLHRLKAEQLVVFRGSAPIGDYTYELTDQGADRARRYSQQSTYFGTAPVPLEEYNRSVQLQALKNQHPRLDDVHRAFTDLVISNSMATQIGEAMNLGMGFFLYGEPGNGKTSIAERITQAYGESIWIPRAILAGGEILRLFDSTRHIALPHGVDDESTIDQRWVRIRRPTISVGGELQLNNLEVTINTVTGIMEAPVQMKANCGTFVIDDFGRHRFRPY
ncbi:MAG: hypothetical protein KDA99_08580 [Planctomycetales bacterium]|nr:hypothetical protein [Planctomycetales bacterium]